MVHTVEVNTKGFTNYQVADSKKDLQAYGMVIRPSPNDFERVVNGKMI